MLQSRCFLILRHIAARGPGLLLIGGIVSLIHGTEQDTRFRGNWAFMSNSRKEIFVFGSCLTGKHLHGAAKFAHSNYGAEWGTGEGLTGDAYAVPTKDDQLKPRHILDVALSIKTFIRFARENPKLRFKVTRVGCGLAGFTSEQIAPLFADAPKNCKFDPEWARFGLPTWE